MKPDLNMRQGKHVFSLCMRLFFIAGIVITLLYSIVVYTTGSGVIAGWQSLKPWLAGWRLGLFLSLMGAWPYWVNRYARWAKLNTEQQQVLLAIRWRVAIALLLVELILVQQGLVVLLS